MKKIAMILALCPMLMSSDAYGNEGEKIFRGFYLGGGLGWNFVKYNSYRLGVSGGNEGDTVAYDEQKVNRPMLSLVLGYGDIVYPNIYVGLEGIVDIAQNKTKSVLISGKEILEVSHDSDGGYVKHKGIAAEIGVRFGYVFDNSKTMVYMRPGASFFNEVELWNDIRRTFQGTHQKIDGHPKKIAFAIALGAEKIINDNFSARLEAGYLFRRSFETNSIAAHNGTDTGWRTKANTKSYNVRLLAIYNFK